MATTQADLYRSLMGEMGKSFKNLKIGTYPGDGVLYTRWVDSQRFSKKENKWVTDRADVTVIVGKDEPEVKAGGGTSLHDVSGWFPCKEFWIPEGTEYSTEIYIRKDAKKK